MNKEGLNLNEVNINKLKSLFPECVIDDKLDFDVLKTILGDYVQQDEEKYSFQWPGKRETIKQCLTPSTCTLVPCVEKSEKWEDTNNIYIEGDNLDVLKTMAKTYHSKTI